MNLGINAILISLILTISLAVGCTIAMPEPSTSPDSPPSSRPPGIPQSQEPSSSSGTVSETQSVGGLPYVIVDTGQDRCSRQNDRCSLL